MSEWNMYDTLSEGKRNNNLCMHGPVAAAAAAALCIAILLFLQLLLFVMVCRMIFFCCGSLNLIPVFFSSSFERYCFLCTLWQYYRVYGLDLIWAGSNGAF